MQHISTEIGISAPASRVWTVLMDFATYGEWNPFIQSLSGTSAVGSKLKVTVRPVDGQPMSFEPEVVACELEREFRWLGRVLVAGVFDGEHALRLAPVSENACKFIHEEKFSGLLVPLIMRGKTKAGTVAGFEAMNQALKIRVERQ